MQVQPLEISNCGALNISKVASNPGVTSTALFHYSVDQAPPAAIGDDDIVHDSTLAVNLNGSGSTTEPDTNYKELDANITIGGTHNWTNVISLNRPGMSGDFEPWEGWSHARRHAQAVPA